MAQVYADCNSYQDTGTVTTSGAFTSTTTFNTAFERPDRFRFEVTAPTRGQSGETIWSSG